MTKQKIHTGHAQIARKASPYFFDKTGNGLPSGRQGTFFNSGTHPVQTKCAECEKGEMQTKPDPNNDQLLRRQPMPGTTPPPGTPLPMGERKIQFAHNSPALSELALQQIRQYIRDWRARGANTTVNLDGYASTEGADDYNFNLSRQRVLNVRSEMLHPSNGESGIPQSFITLEAHGETNRFSATDLSPNRTVLISSSSPVPPPHPPPPPPNPSPQPQPPLPNHYSIQDCSTAYEAEIRDAIDEARRKLLDVANAIMSPGSNARVDASYRKFFGTNSRASIALRLLIIRHSLESVGIECENPGSLAYGFFCPAGVLAYTRAAVMITGIGHIHVCQPQFHNMTRAQRIGTIVHEGAHRYIYAPGDTYYTLDCLETTETLAMSDGDRFTNADCFGCLIQEQI
ncbi:MAG: hypothetical protein BGO55_03600 [Sphingobacteriales bacterium 50-39]|nr:OmpA family protein [Sphingobacteriales bacterium]OJW55634.1 MAG: hypothetical protein BGO55_03600 [Sphingobacteriales bacterium 50-39]